MRVGDYVKYECTADQPCEIGCQNALGVIVEVVPHIRDCYRVQWQDDNTVTTEFVPINVPRAYRNYQVHITMTEDGPIETGVGFGVG